MRPMQGADKLWRAGLLLAAGGLAQCDDGGGGGREPAGAIAIVSAYPQLTFASPIFFAQAPGDAARAFVVTQDGRVLRFDHAATASTTTTFLDIRDLVTDDGGEQGLLGLAFDPDFGTNGYLYVNYNPNFDATDNDPARRTRISRFAVTANPDSVDPATELPLLEYDQPYSNHKGGWLGFGPDDMLYIASGDGGSGGDPENRAQNLDSLLGKILRIEPDGGVPADNPFVGIAGRDEIWAYGLRNPFRASFDRTGGDLWVADVGQGQREEIDLVTAGGNYGWRKFEGTRVNNAGDPTPGNALPPLYEYDHSNGRCSIIGGYAYRGSALAGHAGDYFYADYCSREVWTLRRNGNNVQITFIGTVPDNPSSFGEDLAGELYLTAFDGKIYKLVPSD